MHRLLAIVVGIELLCLSLPASSQPKEPLNCGNLELTISKSTQRKAVSPDTSSAYDLLLRGHAYEFVDGEPIARTHDQLSAITEDLNEYVARTPKPVIVLHFHGGLVDRCQGYTGAASLRSLYESVGAFSIFPIYNVGTGESIDKGWSGLSARDPRYGGDGRAMSFTRRFWYGRGLLADPVPDVRSIALIDRLNQIAAERATRFDGKRTHEDRTTSPNGTLTKREEQLRLGIVPKLNDGYMTGGRAWSYMKFVIDRSLALDTAKDHIGDRQSAAMLVLMDAIHDVAFKQNKDVSIVLVGHSTGAIYAAKFLRAWNDAADLPWKDAQAKRQRFTMLLMAPAVRYDVLERTLREAGSMLQGRFRTFTMTDDAERDSYDGPAPAIRTAYYRLSLLYAISGIFEPWPDAPLLGMQRFACPPFSTGTAEDYVAEPATPVPGKLYAFTKHTEGGIADIEAVRRVHTWFKDNHVAHPFAFSPSPLGPPDATPPGMRTTSIQHGDFPRDFATMSSIAFLVQASWNSGTEAPWNVGPTPNVNCPVGDAGTAPAH